MRRPQKAANVRNPLIEDLQKDKKETCWKEDTNVGEYIAAHDKIRERWYL